MMLPKACPRCRGDLHANSDSYRSYRQCLQCGYLQDLEDRPRMTQVVRSKVGKRAA